MWVLSSLSSLFSHFRQVSHCIFAKNDWAMFSIQFLSSIFAFFPLYASACGHEYVQNVNCLKAAGEWVFVPDRTRIFTHYSRCVSINGWRFCVLFVTLLFNAWNHSERAHGRIETPMLWLYALCCMRRRRKKASKNEVTALKHIICTDTYNQIKSSSKSIKDVDSSPCSSCFRFRAPFDSSPYRA